MPKIKNPLLIDQTFGSYQKVYEVDVEGKKVIATYTYDGEYEERSGWDYDLTPCYVDLTEDEIQELEDEFYEVLSESTNGEFKHDLHI
jgi:hypothetical protein